MLGIIGGEIGVEIRVDGFRAFSAVFGIFSGVGGR